jgi:predicted Holliday junction resolvase-like endonuclease
MTTPTETESKIKELLSNPLVRLAIVVILIVIVFFILEYQMKKMHDKVQFINHRVIKGLSRQSLINTLENKIQSVNNTDSENEEDEEDEEEEQ